MKKNILLAAFIFLGLCQMEAQVGVGVGTVSPVTTLDVMAVSNGPLTAEGFIGPRLTGNQLTAKNTQYTQAHNGAIVYVTEIASATTGKTRDVKSTGFYFYDSAADGGLGLWISFADNSKQQFYFPTTFLPTDRYTLPDGPGYSFASSTFRVDLFQVFNHQIGAPVAVSNTSSSLKQLSGASNYYYFVLYYDTSVFRSVSISSTGVLSYMLVSGYILSDKTFMSIMVRER